jgi:hypothetical protein
MRTAATKLKPKTLRAGGRVSGSRIRRARAGLFCNSEIMSRMLGQATR